MATPPRRPSLMARVFKKEEPKVMKLSADKLEKRKAEMARKMADISKREQLVHNLEKEIETRAAALQAAKAALEAFSKNLKANDEQSVMQMIATPLRKCVDAYLAFCATRAEEPSVVAAPPAVALAPAPAALAPVPVALAPASTFAPMPTPITPTPTESLAEPTAEVLVQTTPTTLDAMEEHDESAGAPKSKLFPQLETEVQIADIAASVAAAAVDAAAAAVMSCPTTV